MQCMLYEFCRESLNIKKRFLEEETSKLELADVYERECVKNEGPIYTFNEMRTLLEASEPNLKDFFTQLYSVARPFEQTMDRMEK